MNIEDWLREFLSPRMSEAAVDRVISRVPGHLLRGDPSALSINASDYESMEGMRLLVSELGRSLLEEGEAGSAALSEILRWMESGGESRAMIARWYRMTLKMGRGLEIK
ncbi:MAG: hypothetical protein RXP97_05645 [Nitrososphaeria archaeon]